MCFIKDVINLLNIYLIFIRGEIVATGGIDFVEVCIIFGTRSVLPTTLEAEPVSSILNIRGVIGKGTPDARFCEQDDIL